ncbi:MAG: Ig domain-containing protein [Paludibacteraceae bacterium]|nr:Ig domain-containing protein [Paludibacteraceae bacterium]
MKANKFFAVALAALTLVSFNACNKNNGGDDPKPEEETTLTLNPTALTLNVGDEATIAATVEATWTITDETVATVTPANDGGKSANVKALKAGNAIITATTKGGQTKTCVVSVNAGGGGGGDKTIDAKRIWPVVLDAVTAEKNASIIAGDFRVNDVDNFLYIWPAGESYIAGEGTGKNYFGNTEGYVALTVAQWNQAWSGLGFCINNADAITAMQGLKEAIVANPDKFYLHLGMKATNAGNHQFYTFGNAATSFNIGQAAIEAGPVIGDFERDGEWHGFDIPLAQFASAIANANVEAGINILCALSGAQIGAQLNMDAVYFYEKE